MEIVISLNKKDYLYDYKSMGIRTFVLGCSYSFYAPYKFNKVELKEIIENNQDCHFYVSLNYLYDQHMINEIEKFIDYLNEINVHGIIFQDFGVLQIVKEKGYCFDMMYSPETLNTNVETLNTLSKYGITSAYVSKVIPLEEQIIIKESSKIPLMIQVHGVEYIAASKRKLVSNYIDASSLSLDSNDLYTIQAKNSDQIYYMYEDHYGTHIFTKNRLYTIDLFNHFNAYDYLYIETMFMKDEESIEVASLYSDALTAHKNLTYNKESKELLPLLLKLNTPLHRGFLFDSTVYKLEDMRRIENEKH